MCIVASTNVTLRYKIIIIETEEYTYLGRAEKVIKNETVGSAQSMLSQVHYLYRCRIMMVLYRTQGLNIYIDSAAVVQTIVGRDYCKR